jgi:hypothetical protein
MKPTNFHEGYGDFPHSEENARKKCPQHLLHETLVFLDIAIGALATTSVQSC